MTDEAWEQGMADLLASLPSQDDSPGRKARRGVIYRERLGHLTDGQWLYAVGAAIERERWFPPVSALLEYASEAPPVTPESKGYLPPSSLTDEDRAREVEQRRAAVAEGMNVVREALAAQGIHLDRVGAPMPTARPSDERRARVERLREQARRITAESAEPVQAASVAKERA